MYLARQILYLCKSHKSRDKCQKLWSKLLFLLRSFNLTGRNIVELKQCILPIYLMTNGRVNVFDLYRYF